VDNATNIINKYLVHIIYKLQLNKNVPHNKSLRYLQKYFFSLRLVAITLYLPSMIF
jgi:hypothetical protein